MQRPSNITVSPGTWIIRAATDRRRRASARAPAGNRRRASESTGRCAHRTDGGRDRFPASGASIRSRRSRPIRTWRLVVQLDFRDEQPRVPARALRLVRLRLAAPVQPRGHPRRSSSASPAPSAPPSDTRRTRMHGGRESGPPPATTTRGLAVCSLVRVEDGNGLSVQHERHRERDTPGRQRRKAPARPALRCCPSSRPPEGGGRRSAGPLPVRPL